MNTSFFKKIIGYFLHPFIGLGNLLRFFTILPIPACPYLPLHQIFLYVPIVGLLIGCATAACYHLFYALGLPPFLSGFTAIALQIILTGALHEDGLADSADALGIAVSPEQNPSTRLQKVRKDPFLGSYGVIALIVSLSGKWLLLTALIYPKYIWAIVPLAHMLSRTQWIVLLHMLPLAAGSKLGQLVKDVTKTHLGFSLLMSLLFALLIFHLLPFGIYPEEILLLLWLLQIYGLSGFIRRKYGGLSGDVMGAIQQFTEIFIIFAAAILIFMTK